MRRFFVTKDNFKRGKFFIGPSQSHHIIDVMRLKEQDKLLLFDGSGREYICRIERVEDKLVVAAVVKTQTAGDYNIAEVSLAVAVPKNNFEFIIQKATELGAYEIIPMETKRTIVKFDISKNTSKKSRWDKIILQSCEQSGRAQIPIIREQIKFCSILDKIKDFDAALIPTLCPPEKNISEALKGFKGSRILLLIGPEGDFTEGEVNAAVGKGAVPVTLGALVLKVDTACAASLAIIMNELSISR